MPDSELDINLFCVCVCAWDKRVKKRGRESNERARSTECGGHFRNVSERMLQFQGGPERATSWLEVPESAGYDIFLRLLTSIKMSISLKLFIPPATTHPRPQP